jgi:hypothetical protein
MSYAIAFAPAGRSRKTRSICMALRSAVFSFRTSSLRPSLASVPSARLWLAKYLLFLSPYE